MQKQMLPITANAYAHAGSRGFVPSSAANNPMENKAASNKSPRTIQTASVLGFSIAQNVAGIQSAEGMRIPKYNR